MAEGERRAIGRRLFRNIARGVLDHAVLWKADLDRLDERLTKLQEQTLKATEEFGPLSEKVQAGLMEVKDELSSMIKFSFAELERRLNALEARIKLLEKIVLQ